MIRALRPLASTIGRSAAPRTSLANAVPRKAGFSIRTVVTKRYTIEHEWISFDDSNNVGKIGITDYAQGSLGDVVFVELPSADAEVKRGDQIGSVESVKAASDIYAPVSGIVQSVNKELDDTPSLLNKSPEDEGWLCEIKLSDPKEVETLLSEEAYKAHCEGSEH